MPDPATTLTAAGILTVAAKQFQDFIAAISGHKGESIGTMLGSIGRARFENAEAVGNRAHYTFLNLGVNANPVPLAVLGPLLEGASFQDEPSMQELWANLLANAADPRQLTKVHPAFVTILKELTPEDALFLNALYEQMRSEMVRKRQGPTGIEWDIFQLKEIYNLSALKIPPAPKGKTVAIVVDNQFETLIEILVRHGILTRYIPTVIKPRREERKLARAVWSLSSMGRSFLSACQHPPRPS